MVLTGPRLYGLWSIVNISLLCVIIKAGSSTMQRRPVSMSSSNLIIKIRIVHRFLLSRNLNLERLLFILARIVKKRSLVKSGISYLPSAAHQLHSA